MNENIILGQLEELAGKLGIQIRYEAIKREGLSGTGGLCRLKEEYVLIVNSSTTVKNKIRIFAGAVKRFDLDQVYIRPALREFLDTFPVFNTENES